MATKKEVLNQALEILAKYKAPKQLVDEITVLLAPKKGGASINLDEVTKKDANGKIVEILCSVSNKWLPATPEFFYTEKDSSKGINGLKRISKQGESIRKAFNKQRAASEKAIMTDVIEGHMSPEEGKAKLAKLKQAKPDYSSVTR